MVGKRILHYNIIEQLGSGGIGIVYKAEDSKLNRTVALKFLSHLAAINDKERDRFKQEAMTAACLNHQNIATIYDLAELDNEMFIVMEFIEGKDLRKVINNNLKLLNYPLKLEKVVLDIIKITEGLKAAHDKGIVHRDIKPENIMVNNYGQIKITDFGLAKIINNELLTKTGTFGGTLAYMSPEQLSFKSVDIRSDIWSLGVMFYEMLAGEPPFKGDYEQSIIYSILNENPKQLKYYYNDIPQELEIIVRKTLAKDPNDRYQNCEELLYDLQSYVQTKFQNKENSLELKEKKSQKKTDSIIGLNVLRNIKSNKTTQTILKVVIVILFFVLISIYFVLKSPPEKMSGKKIAVLPFVNINNNPTDEYFSDGIMEDILTQLVKISDLKVISRTTMMKYKNSNLTIDEISKELNADIILEGSVRRNDNNLRISVQLIDSRRDEHLWAETYDKKLDQIFNIQSEIALKIANTLQARLSNKERDMLGKPKSNNPEVYNLMLKGRYLVNKLDSLNVTKAIGFFNEALLIEPNNAHLWVLLANAFTVQADLGFIDVGEGYSKARFYIEKALSLEDKIANAHVVLGTIKMVYDWDWEGSELEFQKAIKLEPWNATTLNQLGQLALTLGRLNEAILYMKQSIDLEPLNLINYLYLSQFFIYADSLDEAINILGKGLELNPQFPYLHYSLGSAYLLRGDSKQAIVEFKKEPIESYQMYGLLLAYYKMGLKKKGDNQLKECISMYQDIGAYYIAQVYAYSGNNDKAFEWLDKAYLQRDGSLTFLKGDPFFKNIEKDIRYIPFMKKMKLM